MPSEQKLAVRMQARVGYKVPFKPGRPMSHVVSEPKRSTAIAAWVLTVQDEDVQWQLQVSEAVWWLSPTLMRHVVDVSDVHGVGSSSQYRTLHGYALQVEFKYVP